MPNGVVAAAGARNDGATDVCNAAHRLFCPFHCTFVVFRVLATSVASAAALLKERQRFVAFLFSRVSCESRSFIDGNLCIFAAAAAIVT